MNRSVLKFLGGLAWKLEKWVNDAWIERHIAYAKRMAKKYGSLYSVEVYWEEGCDVYIKIYGQYDPYSDATVLDKDKEVILQDAFHRDHIVATNVKAFARCTRCGKKHMTFPEAHAINTECGVNMGNHASHQLEMEEEYELISPKNL